MRKDIKKKVKENLGKKGEILRQLQQVSLSGAHHWWLQRMTLTSALLGFTVDHNYVSKGKMTPRLCWLEDCRLLFSLEWKSNSQSTLMFSHSTHPFSMPKGPTSPTHHSMHQAGGAGAREQLSLHPEDQAPQATCPSNLGPATYWGLCRLKWKTGLIITVSGLLQRFACFTKNKGFEGTLEMIAQ